MTENEFILKCDEFNRFARQVIGKNAPAVAAYVAEDDRTHFIVLSYGNRHVRIRTDGYNAMHILSRLYSNEVTEAILR